MSGLDRSALLGTFVLVFALNRVRSDVLAEGETAMGHFCTIGNAFATRDVHVVRSSSN